MIQTQCNKLKVNKSITVRSVTYFISYIEEACNSRYPDGMYYIFKFDNYVIDMSLNEFYLNMSIRFLLIEDLNFSYSAVSGLRVFGYSWDYVIYTFNEQFTKEFDPYYRWVINAK